MASPLTGFKETLTIAPVKENKNKEGKVVSVSVDESNPFVATLNPPSYKHVRKIAYTTDSESKNCGKRNTPQGMVEQPEFAFIKPDDLIFDFWIDGTGATGLIETARRTVKQLTVEEQVDRLTNIVYPYQGTQHEPPIVRLLWGSMVFFARLKAMSLDYTLFKPSGEPLRVKVNLSFEGRMTKDKQKLLNEKSSPDLTHVIQVQAGDTLPLLCHRIYNDSSYYMQVARINKLVDFRNIEPGDELLFPPLKEPHGHLT